MLKRQAIARIAKDGIWRFAFPRWNRVPLVAPGYTLLAPVPGDLPAFAHLVLAVAAQQDAEGRVETILVPDHVTPEFGEVARNARSLFDIPSLRVTPVGGRGAAIRSFVGPGSSMPHFIQIYYGTLAVRTAHVLLHDADLFVHNRLFFRDHYRQCLDRGLACHGVAPAWDEWLRAHGAPHVVATWELMFETEWLRQFPPWQHRAHFADWGEGRHGFDTMLFPQAHTPADRCGLNTRTEGLLHFRHIFGHYRTFQRFRGDVYDDGKFVILFIRLLHDVYCGEIDPSARGSLPPIRELVRGLSDRPGRISYRFPRASETYAEFRKKIDLLLDGPLVSQDQAARLLDELGPFDAAFASA